MNYELCKKLKDAGFPQVFEPDTYVYTHPNNKVKLAILEEDYKDVDYWVKIPKLSELIEACGERFVSLEVGLTNKPYKENIRGKEWYSCGGSYLGQESIDGEWQFESWGSTPEEAVAKLWLALNKK